MTGVTASRIAGNPRDSGYKRANLDWYVEPMSATRALLRVEKFTGDVLDPACGSGNIVEVCREAGLTTIGADIEQRGAADYLQDFLALNHAPWPVENIICNPPFAISLAFAKKALEYANKVAFIQRLCWLEGQKRAAFLEQSPLARIWVFRNRICMPPGEKRDLPAKGGFIAYAWFVWEHGHKGPPTLGWITA